jgi:hypothetical protein
MHDTYLDDIIFGYTDIFPIDEQTALANAGSKDHLDILVAAGINIPLTQAKECFSSNNVTGHAGAPHLSKSMSMPPLAPKNKKGAIIKQGD